MNTYYKRWSTGAQVYLCSQAKTVRGIFTGTFFANFEAAVYEFLSLSRG